MLTQWAAVACLIHGTWAQTSTTSTIGSAPTSVSTTPATSVSSVQVSTAVASAVSAAATAVLPSQVPLPPTQAWCPSEIFCAGSLLQTVNVANLYADPKTFVDKPTNTSSKVVLAAFANLTASGNVTEQQLIDFVDTNFRGEGLELEALTLTNFTENPAFLKNVTDSTANAFAQKVHSFWTQLIRGTNATTLCAEGGGGKCESSLIPLNHTFVVPGGRFREQYYWDSFWIVEGLIESQLYDIVNGTLQNFMDELETIGFIPNGGRIYYLNRSQPPLFIQMLARYVTATNDTTILKRALPLAEKELKWWQDNRTLNITSPFTNKTHALAHYAVNNTAPRPESYLTDYDTANGPDVDPPLNETQRADLYAELASGAETGWDYSSRWLAPGSSDLTTLQVRSTIAVDLNSILYKNHVLLASLYGSSNKTAASRHSALAASIRAGILDLFWDSSKLAFYDYNIKSQARNDVFSTATFYPLWSGIIPDEILKNATNAFSFFSSVHLVLNRYNGTFPTTFLDTGLQWDAPNTWPPHQYIVLQALRALPSNITKGSLPTLSANQSTFDLVPSNQLGIGEAQLPVQPLQSGANATTSGPSADINTLNGTVINGGNATDGEGWGAALQRQLANRYFSSAFCSWRATGGSIPGIVPRYSDAELNVTLSIDNTGNMFEKFSNLGIDSAGRGGEYTVQAGFGWTNGVLLWVASNYGGLISNPSCPSLLVSNSTTGDSGSTGNGTSGDGSQSGGGNGTSTSSSGSQTDDARSSRTLVSGALVSLAGAVFLHLML